MGPDTG